MFLAFAFRLSIVALLVDVFDIRFGRVKPLETLGLRRVGGTSFIVGVMFVTCGRPFGSSGFMRGMLCQRGIFMEALGHNLTLQVGLELLARASRGLFAQKL